MKAIIVLVLLALGAFAQTPEPHMNCLPQIDFAFFDLRSLQSTRNNNTDFVAKFNPLGTDKISFSLCQPIVNNCSSTPTHGAFERVDKPCLPLTGVRPDQAYFQFLSEKNRSEGIKVILTGGTDGINMTVNIKCSNETKIGRAKTVGNKGFEVAMESPAGCSTLDIRPIMNYVSGEAWVLKVGLMIVGLLLTFLGRQLVKPTLFILGFSCIFLISSYFIMAYMITATTAMWTIYAIFGGCIFGGLLIGYIAVKIEFVGYMAVGGILGYAFGNFLFMSVFVHTKIPNAPLYMYGTMVVSGAIFGFAMCKFRDTLMIAATSLFGALMVSRTFFMAVAALPSEAEIINMFENGGQISPVVWGYLALYVLLAALGIWVQKSRKTSDDDWGNHKEVLILNAQNPYGYYHRA